MSKASTNKPFFFLIFAIPILLLDQGSKIFLSSILVQPIALLGNFFTLRLEHNYGMAFSISLPYPLLLALNLLFFGGLTLYLIKHLNLNNTISQIILTLLISGALGNLLDRLRLGYVIDFISVGSFPIFNFADSFITVSIFLLVLFYDKIRRPN